MKAVMAFLAWCIIIGVFVYAGMVTFVSTTGGDGFGRPIIWEWWFIRWVGWKWFFVDQAVFWGGIFVAYELFKHSEVSAKRG